MNERTRHTDIAVHWSMVNCAASPDEGVDSVYGVDDKEPANHGERRDIARAYVPWQRDEDKVSNPLTSVT
jgi:hypothetical protein